MPGSTETTMPGCAIVVLPAALLIALAFCSLLLLIQDKSPVEAAVVLFQGGFGSLYALQDTMLKAIPIFLCSLGVSVAFRMKAELFVTWNTLLILALGLVGFVFDTVGGVFFAKFLNLFSKKKINPMIGAAGISAFPMASRMVHKLGREEDPNNFLLMHAAGANVSGQIASVIAGGLIITLVEQLL